MPTFDWVTQIVTGWLSLNAGLFVPEAHQWARYFVVGLLVLYGLGTMAPHIWPHAPAMVIRTLVFWAITNFILNYYDTPTRLLAGHSFHQLIPETFRKLTLMMHTGTMANMTTQLQLLMAGIPIPKGWQFLQGLLYVLAYILTIFAEGVLGAISIISLPAMAVGIIAGPLSWAFLVFPPTWRFLSHLPVAWVNYMLSWGAYGFIAAILVDIWARIVTYGLNWVFHGNYTLVQAVIVIKLFFLLNLAMIFSCGIVHYYAGALFGYASSGAAGFSGYLKRSLGGK